MKYEFEIGGQVKISDRWYEIEDVDYSQSPCTVMVEIGEDVTWVCEAFVQDYERPEPEEEAFSREVSFSGSDHITVTFSTGLTVTFTTEQLLKLQAL